MEQTLKERLEKILRLIDKRADDQLRRGEDMVDTPLGHSAVGFSVGAQFARDLIVGEFQEFWPEDANNV